ncbi:hypothetical protein BU17DRAFT_101033 [Hysterangium stoloniferum]|nr:hypothetical protein BU17DRAFT_101033 [Hysterangium stoloniferum]
MRFPYFVQMGLIASSTPFVNGHPSTLFFNDEVHSSGAVGVALRTPRFFETTICFGGLEPLAAGLGVVTHTLIRTAVLSFILPFPGELQFTSDAGIQGLQQHAYLQTNILTSLIVPGETSATPEAALLPFEQRWLINGTLHVIPRARHINEFLNASDITSLLFFSDKSPHGLVRTLDRLPVHPERSRGSDHKAYTRAEEAEDELPKKTFQVLEPTDLVDEDDESMDVIRSSDSDRNDSTACPPAQDVEHELLSAHMVVYPERCIMDDFKPPSYFDIRGCILQYWFRSTTLKHP